MTIPFVNLLSATDHIRISIDQAINRVRDRGIFLNGPETELFEEELGAATGRHCIACASGTDALSIAAAYHLFGMTAVNDPFSPVGIPANTSPFTQFGIWERNPALARSNPCVRTKIVDVNERGWPESFKDTIPVLLYGRIPNADLSACPLIDACQAHGWRPTNRTSCLSFYPSKNLGAFGDGGAILCRDERDVANLRKLVWPGEHYRMHSRMSEINASVLRTKLPHLDRWNAERAAIAEVYYNELPDWCDPACRHGEPTNHHIFAVLVERRNDLEMFLKVAGIGCKVHWPEPLENFPGARYWADHVLSLPMWPGLTPQQVQTVCDTIKTSR
jgi:dTDP-3-amino-3,4,6-trideoxy-alpha-D-glucose transaminase